MGGGLGGVARYWGMLPAMCFCWPASFCGFGGAGGVGWGWGAMGSGAVMFLGLSPHLLAVVGWTVVFLRALGVARGGGDFLFSSGYIHMCGFYG